jgi:restriction endonuclease Mrr
VILLSGHALAGAPMQEELTTALDRRDVDVVPVLLDAVDLPASLRGRKPVDLREGAGFDRMVDRLLRGSSVDLATLTPIQFEALIRELLQRYGYTITQTARSGQPGYDLVATHIDPLGLLDPVEFLVEVKLYRRDRVSVSEIHRLAGVVLARPGASGLFVTNAQLTSAARMTLEQLTASGSRVKTIDGPLLRQMLVEHPDIARQYGQALGTDSTR